MNLEMKIILELLAWGIGMVGFTWVYDSMVSLILRRDGIGFAVEIFIGLGYIAVSLALITRP